MLTNFRIIRSLRLLVGSVIFYSFAANSDDPHIDIVLGFAGMAEYADAVMADETADHVSLGNEFIYSKYFESCSGEGKRRGMSRQFLSEPIGDVKALAGVINEIQKSDAVRRIERAAEAATELLPIDKLTVCVFAVPPDSDIADFVIDTFNGVYGFSESPGVLWIQLLPTSGWLDEIFPGFSHEYFHAAAHPDNPMGTNEITLLDLLVNEGGADSFTAILYPDFVPSWTHAISLQQEIELWPRVRKELDSTDMNFIQNVMFGDGDTFPFQSGYTIGYQIVQGYLASHPDDPPIVWSRVDPKEILAESGYVSRVAPGED